jgi:hypothetical protein
MLCQEFLALLLRLRVAEVIDYRNEVRGGRLFFQPLQSMRKLLQLAGSLSSAETRSSKSTVSTARR